MEKVTYNLLTLIDGKNPTECSVDEEFSGNTKTLVRVMIEKVPKKRFYVIVRQEQDHFPEVLNVYSNIKCASDKILEYTLEHIQEKLDYEKDFLFVDIVVNNHTCYDQKRFNRIKGRLEKKFKK